MTKCGRESEVSVGAGLEVRRGACLKFFKKYWVLCLLMSMVSAAAGGLGGVGARMLYSNSFLDPVGSRTGGFIGLVVGSVAGVIYVLMLAGFAERIKRD